MNKKLLTICLAVVLAFAAVCCVACIHNDNTTDKLREINTAMLFNYSKIELNVTTRSSDLELKSKFVVAESNGIANLSYDVERVSVFDANGTAPSEFITRAQGVATVSNGAVVSVDGSALSEAIILDVVDTSMAFRLAYLDSIKVDNDVLSAKVTNPQGFLQRDDFEGTDMTVRVTLAQSNVSRVIIDYKLNSSTVQLDYSFTR